jgi:4-amino-4-deoxychorismate lyase
MAASALAWFEFDPSGSASGYRLADPAVPALTVTELAATRGDGVFETVGLHEGRPIKTARHFERFANSARMLDLPAQDWSVWEAALRETAAALDPAAEGWVKLVLSRGIEGGTTPTGWAYATVSASTVAVREEGLRVVLLDRGYPSDIAQTAPWLLQGAKTISYAVNRSVYREAARRDADDVVFVTSDGVLLEGPTSTLVVRSGMTLRTTPTDLGILAGTTQAELFEWAGRNGYTTAYDRLTPADLATADAAWLVSSVRLAAPIRAVDGIPKPVDAALTASFTAHLHSLAT